ncbi:MAG: UDP-N-acetylglucosamine 2-epimerase (non-hydrolyzing) [Elusimicrobia bacterium]|nr:UDP-N-acetylglucosamine 2-epimerase (non-hydrolyzing) [Elusimicrobiota bacterium]
MRVLAVAGTRPEVIKLAPVLARLRREPGVRVRLCVTAQHRRLLDDMLKVFGLKPHADLDLMRPRQTPAQVLRRTLRGMGRALARPRPDLVLVQGDTTTALGAALAAFRLGIPVAHVEAGLRTGDLDCPFPEEANRILIDRGSALLFAPTPGARRNLRREGVPADRIVMTGNTVVDALRWAASRPHRFREPALRGLGSAPLAVVTLHRRESWGKPLAGIFRAILEAARLLPDLLWVYPVHPNPAVSLPARRLLRHPRILLVPPLDYLDFVHLLRRARFIVTDSGGIQEEAPSLGKPVVVAREKTERPETLGRGSLLAGVSRPALVRAILRCARRPERPRAVNPFGDGKAAERIARALLRWARERRP